MRSAFPYEMYNRMCGFNRLRPSRTCCQTRFQPAISGVPLLAVSGTKGPKHSCNQRLHARCMNEASIMTAGEYSWNSRLPFQGNLRNMERLPSLEELHALLEEAQGAVEAYHRLHPHIHNLPKLHRRIGKDLSFVATQLEAVAAAKEQTGPKLWAYSVQGAAPGGEEPEDAHVVSQGRLQGIVNNLRGFHGEIMALYQAVGVVAVSKRFSSTPPRAWAPYCRLDQKPTPTTTSSQARAAAQTEWAVRSPSPPLVADDEAGLEDQHEQQQVGECKGADGAAASPVSGRSAQGALLGDAATATAPLQFMTPAVTATVDALVQLDPTGSSLGLTRTYSTSSTNSSSSSSGGAGGDAGGEGGLVVEVDVVAHDGRSWIEVKNQERFGLESVHWQGGPGHCKGLARQVADLLTVAAAPANWRHWCAPQVVVFFPSGVDPGVEAALRDLGVGVAAGPGSLAQLPSPGGVNRLINLDVTTLCGLVSEVSHAPPSTPALQQWAARTSHWRECLEAEAAQPLLPLLQPHLVAPKSRWVASCAAVSQFEQLLAVFGGPREAARWEVLRGRLQVCHCIDTRAAGNEAAGAPGADDKAGVCCAHCGAQLPPDQLQARGSGASGAGPPGGRPHSKRSGSGRGPVMCGSNSSVLLGTLSQQQQKGPLLPGVGAGHRVSEHQPVAATLAIGGQARSTSSSRGGSSSSGSSSSGSSSNAMEQQLHQQQEQHRAEGPDGADPGQAGEERSVFNFWAHAPTAGDCEHGVEGRESHDCSCYNMPDVVRALSKVSPQQKAVFALGQELQALTVTANGAAVRGAAGQGLALEAVVHRAVWLTGQ